MGSVVFSAAGASEKRIPYKWIPKKQIPKQSRYWRVMSGWPRREVLLRIVFKRMDSWGHWRYWCWHARGYLVLILIFHFGPIAWSIYQRSAALGRLARLRIIVGFQKAVPGSFSIAGCIYPRGSNRPVHAEELGWHIKAMRTRAAEALICIFVMHLGEAGDKNKVMLPYAQSRPPACG